MTRVNLLALLLLVLLSACSAPTDEPTITMKDTRFRQAEMHFKAGQLVTLHVVNEDGYAHAFDIDAFDIHLPLTASETLEIAFRPEQPGRYAFYCSSPGHEAAGMTGTFVVEP